MPTIDPRAPKFHARCRSCIFYDNLDTPPGTGLCRARPPLATPNLRGEVVVGWPQINDNDWCGDWEEIESGDTVRSM